MPTPAEDLCALRAIAEQAGMRRVHMLAWRDLDDVDAGGSELHAATIARLWAGAGLDVTMRTSEVPGRPSEIERDGYRVIRHGSRYSVFAQASMAEAIRPGSRDGLVEIWNGMPFLSPLWHRGPRSIWIHHFHAEMWQMVLPRPVAAAGAFLERRLAPPLYRRSPIVTLSESSRQELVAELGFDPANVSVVSPGVSRTFSPGGERSTTPLVVAIGRLAPVKRFDVLIDALAVAKERCPGLQAVIVGEGDDRSMLQARIDAVGGRDWLTMPGRLSDSDLVALYQRAWVLASSSAREGWGMTITEAAACGTPAVATDISGHRDAIVRDVSGLLVDVPDLAAAITRVLDDPSLRDRLAAGALARAAELTWESTAAGTLRVLIEDARRRKR